MGSLVILPPPDVRLFVDKTAAYVAKNGPEFEERIHTKERHNARFSFLNPNDPYYGYYQRRVVELQEGGSAAIERVLEEGKKEAKMSPAPAAAGAGPEQAPKEPEPLEFLLEMPGISALDLDVIKLTAQYVAKNGRAFVLNLVQREQRNPQFDFLKPGHSLHRLFLSLVDQFSKVLMPSPALLQRLDMCANHKYRLLAQIRDRVAHARYMNEVQRREEEATEKEQKAFAAIDWHDFVIADTIEFSTYDKNVELPTPFDSGQLAAMSVVQRQELWGGRLVTPATVVATDDSMEIEEPAAPPLSKRPASQPQEVNVRYDYVPKAAVTVSVPQRQQCSICGQIFLASEITEHMRIEMLDPKWAQQRQAYLAKHTETNILHSGIDIAQNLVNRTK